jgi:tRNA(fMet)-specific endonuclease VapC
MASVPSDQQFTSSINLGEMFFGANLVQPRTDYLLEQIQRRVVDEIAIISFDASAARVYGELRARLQREGLLIGDADTQIASVALSRNLIMVTGNVRHFERIPGLTVENWFE